MGDVEHNALFLQVMPHPIAKAAVLISDPPLCSSVVCRFPVLHAHIGLEGFEYHLAERDLCARGDQHVPHGHFPLPSPIA